MPFPFFRLPFELRYIIYQYLFTPEYRDSLIVPDMRHSDLPDSGQRPAVKGLNCQTLPLMRTCQQAHDESTSVLYGGNTFHFGGVLYDKEDIRLIRESSDFYPAPCEVFHFYPFLSIIGRANQMKLRHLDLRLYTYAGCDFPGEDDVWHTKYKPDLSVTSPISNVLDFLSESHRLQSLILHFRGLYWGMVRFSFWFSKDSKLYRSLRQLKAIRKLKCRVHMDHLYELDDAEYAVYEEAVDNYRELKAELAATYALESGRVSSSSTKKGLQSDPTSQFGASA